MFKLFKDKSVLTTTLHLEKDSMIKAETLATVVESLAKTMEGVNEGLNLPKHDIRVKNIKIKKDKVKISLKPVLKKKSKPTIITINKESLIGSVLKDISSFMILGALFWFNYQVIGGSYFVNFLIIFLSLIYIIKSDKKDNNLKIYKINDKDLDKVDEILKQIKEG